MQGWEFGGWSPPISKRVLCTGTAVTSAIIVRYRISPKRGRGRTWTWGASIGRNTVRFLQLLALAGVADRCHHRLELSLGLAPVWTVARLGQAEARVF